MWTGTVEELSGQRGQKFALKHGKSQATYAEVLDGWQHDAAFRSMFLKLLQNAPYSAFRWETPPITKATASRPFEFVLLDSPGLATNPDPSPFAEHLNTSQADVIEFENLGRNAVLVLHVKRGSDPLTDISPPLCGMLPKDNNTLFGKWLPVR